MSKQFDLISPIDNSVYAQLPYATDGEIKSALSISHSAQAQWCHTPIEERQSVCLAMLDALMDKQSTLTEQLTWQMGRPIRYTPGELNGFVERARYMIDIASEKLADIQIEQSPDFKRFIQRQPLGTIFSMVPWNYPYLTAVNSIIPAIMAGNTVIMKPSSQTPLTAQAINDAFQQAGLAKGVFQHLYLDHESCKNIIHSGQINYVAFTGSVSGGQWVENVTADQILDVGLELGGKDPAYVRPDVNVDHAVENLVDGAYFNSGQSCCAIERIYVHEAVYDSFVAQFIDLVKQYKFGNPLDPDTTLGPMVSTQSADRVRKQIEAAIHKGAKTCIDANTFSDVFNAKQTATPYLAPQVLLNVDHEMQIMQEESFGPVVGIMKVATDEQAIQLMNDSSFGLTASVWTQDADAALSIGKQVQTGTWFMNRCDYLDPALAWTGIKQSGKGCTLSEIGYEKLTRAKSFHMRLKS